MCGFHNSIFVIKSLCGASRSLGPRVFFRTPRFLVPRAFCNSPFSGAPPFLAPHFLGAPRFLAPRFHFFLTRIVRGPQKGGTPGICYFCHRVTKKCDSHWDLPCDHLIYDYDGHDVLFLYTEKAGRKNWPENWPGWRELMATMRCAR